MRRAKTVAAIATIAAMAIAPGVFAEAGDWLVRVGGTYIDPDDDNGTGELTGVEVDTATSLTFEVTYMWTENIGIELLAAWPFEHDIDLDGAGQVGKTKQLPPTLSVQYHFTQWDKFKPYVGVGLNYTYFFDQDTEGALAGANLDIDDSFGLAGQVGIDYAINDQWFVNTNVRYININPDVQVEATGLRLEGGVKIDPWLYALNVGYRF